MPIANTTTIPSGYNALFYYSANGDGSTKGFALVISSETKALDATSSSSKTRHRTVVYPWLSRYNASVTVNGTFLSPKDKNEFATFYRSWQKDCTNGAFDTLTYKRKNWSGSGTKTFECVIESATWSAMLASNAPQFSLSLKRASADNKGLNEGITVSSIDESTLIFSDVPNASSTVIHDPDRYIND